VLDGLYATFAANTRAWIPDILELSCLALAVQKELEISIWMSSQEKVVLFGFRHLCTNRDSVGADIHTTGQRLRLPEQGSSVWVSQPCTCTYIPDILELSCLALLVQKRQESTAWILSQEKVVILCYGQTPISVSNFSALPTAPRTEKRHPYT
jgi:hypothetical protein